MTFATDTRAALAGPLLVFIASVVLAMLLYATMQPVGTAMTDEALNMTDTSAGANGIGYVAVIWNNLHYLAVALGALQFIAVAVYRGRLGG